MTKPSLSLRIEVFYKDACSSENIKGDSRIKFEHFCVGDPVSQQTNITDIKKRLYIQTWMTDNL